MELAPGIFGCTGNFAKCWAIAARALLFYSRAHALYVGLSFFFFFVTSHFVRDAHSVAHADWLSLYWRTLCTGGAKIEKYQN